MYEDVFVFIFSHQNTLQLATPSFGREDATPAAAIVPSHAQGLS